MKSIAGGFVIREYRSSDAKSIAAALIELGDDSFVTAQGVQHEVESYPPRAQARSWVATEGEIVLGWARARLKWSSDPSVAHLRVVVRPEARGRGIGSALWTRAEEHLLALQPRKLQTYTDDAPASITFVEHRRFHATRRAILSSLEVGTATLPAIDLPEGVRVVPLREFEDRPRDLFDLYLAAERDLPADEPHGRMTFEEWQQETLEHTDLAWDGSFVVADPRPLAFALLFVDYQQRRAQNEMTGTLPEFRGRGLATLAKVATIRWARANGIERIFTGNDADNAPMLAINRRLGYWPLKTLTDYEREVVKG